MSQFATLLSIHNIVGIVSLIGTLVVVFTVVFIFATSGKEEDKKTAKEKVYKLRRKYFWGLIVVLAACLITSLTMLPYPQYNKNKVDESFSVLAFQWGWKISQGEFNGKIEEFEGKNQIDLQAGKNIKFYVLSKDVNHSFGIYNDKGELVAQTQAMPGYKNELQFVFKDKGDYKVLCMEYCGLAHAFMVATIHVN